MPPVASIEHSPGIRHAGDTSTESQGLLRELCLFDDSVRERLEQVAANAEANGHHPGELLPAARSERAFDQASFLNEYRWIAALSAYAYGQLNAEPRASLMHASEDALFLAAKNYSEEEEPNFLRHLAITIDGYLNETFGNRASRSPFLKPDVHRALSPASYLIETGADNFVTPVEFGLHEGLGHFPLPHERQMSDVHVGQRVLCYIDDGPKNGRRLVQGRIARTVENEYPYMASPDLTTVIPNPSPGFIRFHGPEVQAGYIIDANSCLLIPEDAWNDLRDSPDYRRAWLASGPSSGTSHHEALNDALNEYFSKRSRYQVDARTKLAEPWDETNGYSERIASPTSHTTAQQRRVTTHPISGDRARNHPPVDDDSDTIFFRSPGEPAPGTITLDSGEIVVGALLHTGYHEPSFGRPTHEADDAEDDWDLSAVELFR